MLTFRALLRVAARMLNGQLDLGLDIQRVEVLTALLRRVTPHNVVTALSVMQLLGMMSAGHMVIPLGLLHMR